MRSAALSLPAPCPFPLTPSSFSLSPFPFLLPSPLPPLPLLPPTYRCLSVPVCAAVCESLSVSVSSVARQGSVATVGEVFFHEPRKRAQDNQWGKKTLS